MKSTSIKHMFAGALAIITLLVALIGLGIGQLGKAARAESQANEARYASYLLAQELRQSSDDLTRLARTYVVSADPKWESQYLEVLDIRSGTKPRPNAYEKIYWDFRAADIDPARGSGVPVALTELMRQAGFSATEFAKLREAAANSNDLVKTETIAMNMVKGQFDDGKGGFTRKGEPDLASARTLMHDQNYHLYKARIMKPLDEFLSLLDQRTARDIAVAEALKQK